MNVSRIAIVASAAIGFASAFATSAQAAVVTRNSLNYPAGADVSSAWPGVTLTILTPSRSPIYAPDMSPVIVGACGYGGCTSLSPTNNFGGTHYGALHYRLCYEAGRLGNASSSCTKNWRVLEAVFDEPTDFVEFTSSWLLDAPAIYAYDAAGNEIQACVPGFPLGSTATCMASIGTPVWEHIGAIRVATAKAIIKRVVIGTPSGNSTSLSMQYTCPLRACVAALP